jgi:uncharacterized protein (DUF433 family)
MDAEHPRIALDPGVIRGTRLSVEFVIGLMAEGWNEGDILANYPGIGHDDIIACLAYARDVVSSEKVFPSAAQMRLLSKPEQFAVRYRRPPHLPRRPDIMSDDLARETPIDALVKQHSHGTAAIARSFASSRKAMTCSRFTDGKPFRKSLMDSPASR